MRNLSLFKKLCKRTNLKKNQEGKQGRKLLKKKKFRP